MELVLLPIVESAFDPHATSGANAAGIWQIIPSTGRNYGLKQTRNYDARRDVVASTTAALNMMQRLNKMFDGDWLLTVAAYNSGEGRVMKAIKTNKDVYKRQTLSYIKNVIWQAERGLGQETPVESLLTQYQDARAQKQNIDALEKQINERLEGVLIRWLLLKNNVMPEAATGTTAEK